VCDTSPMAETFDIMAFRARLQAAMQKKGISRKRLSKLAGLGETLMRDLMEKTDNPRVGTLVKVADVLDVSVSSLLGGAVPVLGKIGAGGAILYEEYDEPRYVERPPLASGPMMALEVSGDSMMPAYRDGDIVYVRRDHEGVLPIYLGEECAVHTADGGTFLKVLAPGSQPDRYTLRSFNAADIENVEVVWAAPVLFVKRRPLRSE
jgi:phage repressor protein C with HTH and peptisase S24 domain